MSGMLRNFGPLAAVFAAVAWLCWEHVGEAPAPLDQPERTLTKIERKLLEPELPQPSGRNPLAPVAALVEAEPNGQPTADGAPNLGETSSLAAPAAKAVKFKLRGTFVSGRRKSALIDDWLCFEGEQLPAQQKAKDAPGASAGAEAAPASNAPATSYTLTLVERDYVVLSQTDQEIRLDYSPNGERGRERNGASHR